MEEQKKPFEQSLSELESIVKALEDGNIPLEQMVLLYEQGAKLGKECLEVLDSYEGRIETISRANAGETE